MTDVSTLGRVMGADSNASAGSYLSTEDVRRSFDCRSQHHRRRHRRGNAVAAFAVATPGDWQGLPTGPIWNCWTCNQGAPSDDADAVELRAARAR